MHRAGTTISTWKSAYWHEGVARGDGTVLHNAPGIGEQVIPEWLFVGNSQFRVIEPPEGFDYVSFVSRVQQRISNPRSYSLLSWNCQHTVSWVLTGKAESKQLQMYVLGAVILTTGVAAIAYARKG